MLLFDLISLFVCEDFKINWLLDLNIFMYFLLLKFVIFINLVNLLL